MKTLPTEPPLVHEDAYKSTGFNWQVWVLHCLQEISFKGIDFQKRSDSCLGVVSAVLPLQGTFP